MGLRVVHDLWFCVDCTLFACNGDLSGIGSEERCKAVTDGAERLGDAYGHVSANFDSETGDGMNSFRRGPCDCCQSPLAGEFHRFAVLGEE